MADKKNEFITICNDLDIDHSDMMEDPRAFIKRVIDKSKWLETELTKKNSLNDIEVEFKKDAYKNEPAKARAEEIMSHFMDVLAAEDPAVIANLIPMLSEMTQFASNTVRAMSIRSSSKPHLSKKHLHVLYINLKKCYDAYVGFMKLFHGDLIGIPPVIPAKSGNYGTDSSGSGIKIYCYIIDGERYFNPFTVARMLGVEIKHYMDLTDMVEQNNGELMGVKITLEEI